MARLCAIRIGFGFSLMLYYLFTITCESSRIWSPAPTSAKRAAAKILQMHLNRLNKPAIKTIQSGDGDLIDCVMSTLQPAFDHPLLRNHTIEASPTIPQGPDKAYGGFYSYTQTRHPQTWRESGGCPIGTVAIRRTTEDDILRRGVIEHFGKKRGGISSVPQPENPYAMNVDGHEHAIGFMLGGVYYGAKATINVWRSDVEVPSEFSLSQIWILGGAFNSGLNTIEAGWQVSPELYGDNNPRLFTYWTADAYQSTGCYNILCSGFIQTSNEIAIGATINPVSDLDGPQYDINILVWRDPSKGNWWLRFGDRYLVGYWPAALFTHLADSAFAIEWGGEVVNTRPYGHHTKTDMGSGRFPGQGFGRASYHRNVEYVDSANVLRSPGLLRSLAEQPSCYSIQSGSSQDWGSYFYFGGPGQNINCP